jgi:hypothetical protein
LQRLISRIAPSTTNYKKRTQYCARCEEFVPDREPQRPRQIRQQCPAGRLDYLGDIRAIAGDTRSAIFAAVDVTKTPRS